MVPYVRNGLLVRRLAMQDDHKNKNFFATFSRETPPYFSIRDWSITAGDFFTQTDLDTAANVTVVGNTLVTNLFEPGENPIGAPIRIKNMAFRVVGTLAPKGYDTRGSDQD